MLYRQNVFNKFYSSLFILFLCLFLVLIFQNKYSSAASLFHISHEEQEFAQNSPPIRISYDAYWPPFEKYNEKTNAVEGINYEILKMIAELSGLKFEFVHGLTYSEALEALSQGTNDMHLSYDTNPAKAKDLNAIISDTFLSTPMAMIGKGYDINPESVFAVSRLHPVVMSFVKKTFPDNKILEFDDILDAYKAVSKGKADYTFENVYAARLAISEGGFYDLHIANILPLYDNFSFIFNENVDKRLVSIFNRAIKAFPQERFSSILLEHTIAPSYASKVFQYLSYFTVDLLVGIILLLLVLMLVLFFYSRRQRNLQKSISRKQEQVQNMLDTFPMPIYIADLDSYEVLYCNKAVHDFFDCEDVTSKLCYEVFRNDKVACDNCTNEIIKNLSTPYIWSRYDEVREKHIQFIDSCISWDDKEKVRLSLILDITQTVKLETEKVEEELNAIISDNLPLSITFWNEAGDMVDCNQETLNTFKFATKEEYFEKFHLVSPVYQPDGRNSQEAVIQNHKEVLEKGYFRFEWLHNTTDGEPIPAEVILVKSKLNDETIVISYIKDLRELKATQELLKASELRNNLILDALPLGVHFWDDNGELVYVNNESVKLFGYESREDCIKNFHKIHPEYQPNGMTSKDYVTKQMKDAYELGIVKSETLCLHIHTKEEIPLELYLVRTHYRGRQGIIVYFKDLREHNAMLKEIADNEHKLRHAKELAEQSAKAKSEFLANMSHEIRTPMNGILGLLQLLGQTEMSEFQKDYLAKSVFSANNLMRIINDILDFSKIEAGKLEMEEEPFSLQQIAKDVVDLYTQKSIEKGLELKVDAGLHPQTVLLGDALRLKQVLFNLVSNAIKFTNSGTISLIIESSFNDKSEMECKFAISDTGIGLSQEQISRLFSAFSQADNTVTRKYGGTGLGLAISKNIINMMQGQIWVESELGSGSTFYCTAKFSIAPAELVLNEDSINDDTGLKVNGGHLLLAEDNEINQLVAQELLLTAGFTLDIANNGQEALDLLEKNTYDAVLMDIQMPIMDGFTATEKIRAQEKYSTLPIIAMSAHAMKGDKEISISHGMNDHLTKPIDSELLYKTLNYWINHKIQ